MTTNFDQIYLELAAQSKERSAMSFFEAQKREPNRRIVLYGAGGNCQFALFACSIFKDIQVECICDSVSEKRTYVYQNASNPVGKPVVYQIISPEHLLKEYSDAFVCITTWKYEEEIRASLIQSGFPASQIFYLRNPNLISPEIFQSKYLDGYRWAYEFFSDESSKQKIVDRMRMYLWGDACPPDSLFKDGYMAFHGIHLEDGEVYVDGGAYVGDTAEEFIQNMKAAGKYCAHIYSFEPDPRNRQIAKETLAAYDYVDLVPHGLWSKTGSLCFDSRSGGDHIGSGFLDHISGSDWIESDVLSVPVTSLDDFFEEKPVEEWPTLIKMDIEGAEKEALIGAEEIMKRKKARLVICAYHKPEDIYELPQTILKLRDDYQLFLWQIGESFWDIVLYGI